MKITHSPGHSLVTPGKESPDGYKEWSYTNDIVKLLITELDKYEGVVQYRIDDPTGNNDYPLTVRSNMVNSYAPDLHIDYHLNAYGTGVWSAPGGTETYVFELSQTASVNIGTKVQNNLIKELGFANRGLKTGNLHMLRETTNAKAKILIEFAFMTNKNEAMKMRTVEYHQKSVKAVVDAIVAQYGLRKKVVNMFTDKVTVPNTAHWQASALVQEYQARGFKCYALTSKPYETQETGTPSQFVVETDFQRAGQVKMELVGKGYSLAVWESI